MWKFQINESRQTDGWNDAGIRNFSQNILHNLGREIIQNSLSAAISENAAPVEVHFSLNELPRESIPGIDELRDVLKDIKSGPLTSEDQSQSDGIESAYKASTKSSIKVLSIADYNTFGMDYDPHDESSPFFRYIKGNGMAGNDPDRGGSHGLGKAAPLATTPLRTIFVSTCWQDSDNNLRKLYQGRCRFRSRTTPDRKKYSGTGYWGTDDFEPVEDIENDNFAWLRRDRRGTTVSMPCASFDPKFDWVYILAGYIVCDFFAALCRGSLKVLIEDKTAGNPTKVVIDKDTISDPIKFFNHQMILEEIKNYESDEGFNDLPNAHWYYSCISEQNELVKIKTKELKHLGKVKLSLLVKEGAPRRVCFIRKNMKITEKIKSKGRPGLWEPGYSTPTVKDFVGVVEVLSSEGNRLLRAMEPPQHNKLDIDEMPETLRPKGREAINALSQWLRGIIEEEAPGQVEAERIVSELGEYFHDTDNIDPDSVAVTDEIDPNSPFRLKRKPLKIRKDPIIEIGLGETDNGEDGGSPEVGGGGGGGGGGDGPGEGDGTGGTGNRNDAGDKKQIRLSHQRIVGSNTDFIINLSAKKPFDGQISLFELGLDVKARIIGVNSSSLGEVSDGYIKVKESDFVGNKLKVKIRLRNPVQGGLAVAASEIQ